MTHDAAKRSAAQIFALFLGAGILVVLWTRTAAAEDLSGAAHSTCQMFAKDRLRATAGARFPSLGEPGTYARIRRGSAGRYEVATFVDRRDELGQRVRSRVYCDLRTLTLNHWILDDILIGDGDRRTLERKRATLEANSRAARRQRELIEWVAAGFEQDERRANIPH